MKIAFRTDASTKIGTGHFMRCLTLAEALKKQGADICFVSRNLPLHLSEMLFTKGIELISLSTHNDEESIDELAHASWLGVSQAQDAQETLKSLSGQVHDWMIVDHYALDVRWESIVRPNVKKIMVIDDLADRHHDCDILLDQNYYLNMKSRYIGKVNDSCAVFLGPRYALLREEFRVLKGKVNQRNKDIRRVLIFFGGFDKYNMTEKVIDAVVGMINYKLDVDVVIGENHPEKKRIKSICQSNGFNCYIQTNNMAVLMSSSDLLIGAGGVSIIERIVAKLPSISVACAENQIIPLEALSSAGGTVYLGFCENVTTVSLKDALSIAIESYKELFEGVERLCEEFFSEQTQDLLKLLIEV